MILSRKQTIQWLLALLVGVGAMFYLIKSRDKAPFHVDETCWISSSLYYSDLLLEGDWQWEHWENETLASWGAMNPQVGKWIIGVPLRAHFPEREYFKMYNFEISDAENAAAGNIPPDDLLNYARAISAIVGGLCCLIVFIFCSQWLNAWVGVGAVLLLLGNETFFNHATRVMTDISYNLFLACVGLGGGFLLTANSKKARKYGCIAVGLLIGLACAVKVTGILVGGLYIAGVFAYRALVEKRWKGVIRSLVLCGCSALIMAHVLNPYYWINPGEINFPAMGREIATAPGDIKEFIDTEGSYTVTEVDAAYPQLMNLAHPFLLPYQFIQWKFIMDYMKRLPSTSWGKSRWITFHSMLFSDLATFPLEFPFFVIGFSACLRRVRMAWQAHRVSPFAVPLLFFLANYLFILLFMSLNWDRYYLGTLLATRMLVAYGVYVAGIFLSQKVMQRLRAGSST
ncbi:MAG: hypothetical protein JXR40_11600 [Pontiellaceae bacterium]|nr:hypothetical protein [Pontiellaceae bacterium]